MIVDKACWERGCACYDDRIDKDGVVVAKKEWVGLTEGEIKECYEKENPVEAAEDKLQEKNK